MFVILKSSISVAAIFYYTTVFIDKTIGKLKPFLKKNKNTTSMHKSVGKKRWGVETIRKSTNLDVLNTLGSRGTEHTNLPADTTGGAEEEQRKRRGGRKEEALPAHYT